MYDVHCQQKLATPHTQDRSSIKRKKLIEIRMNIFEKEPSDWKDLQNKVGEIFTDIGCDVEIEKDIETVRGIVNVDVYADNKTVNPNEKIICECKYWNTQVPKSVVHGFRTVIQDYGANSGLIISKSGFQSGAYEATEKSNVKLYTWNEFQEAFKIRWLNSIIDKLEEVGYPLRKITDPMESFYDENFEKLTNNNKNKFIELQKMYMRLSMSSMRIQYKNIMSGKLELEYLNETIKFNSKGFKKDIEVKCLNDYFKYLIERCKKGLSEIDELFGEKVRKY